MDYSGLTGNELDNIDTGQADWGQAEYSDDNSPDLSWSGIDFGDSNDLTPNFGTSFNVDTDLGNWRDSLSMTTGNDIQNTGFLGSGLSSFGTNKTNIDSSGFSGISSPQDTNTNAGIKPANISGWGDVVGTDAKWESPYSAFGGGAGVANNNRIVGERYQNDPLTQASSVMGSIAKYGAMINPALGALAGMGGAGLGQAVRSSYGLPNDYSNWGGTVGSLLGGGGIGSAVGGMLGKMGVQGMQGNYDMMGDTALSSALKTGGSYLGSSLFGPAGATIGGRLASELPGLLAGGYGVYKQNQAANRLNNLAKQSENDSRYYSDSVRSLMDNPDSFANTNMFKQQYARALNQGTRAMANQGMLGSGGRVAGLTDLATRNANNFYNQELNNRMQMAQLNNPQQASVLARLAEAAKGRRNTMIMQQLFGGGDY